MSEIDPSSRPEHPSGEILSDAEVYSRAMQKKWEEAVAAHELDGNEPNFIKLKGDFQGAPDGCAYLHINGTVTIHKGATPQTQRTEEYRVWPGEDTVRFRILRQRLRSMHTLPFREDAEMMYSGLPHGRAAEPEQVTRLIGTVLDATPIIEPTS